MSSSHVDDFEIVWRKMNYDVKTKKHEMRRVLKSVSGRIRSRELVAVMGPSGAGLVWNNNTDYIITVRGQL